MKEIKFRAWHKHRQAMVPVQGVAWDEDFEEHQVQHPDHPIGIGMIGGSLAGYELMHYTGLKDKNGVEIYEGDILRYESMFEDEESRYNPDIYEVEWRGHGWFAAWTGNRASLADGLNDCEKDMVVIGNIYDNPGLLEQNAQPPLTTK